MSNIKEIKTKKDHQKALKDIEALMDTDPDPGSKDGKKLGVLTTLVADYESKVVPATPNTISMKQMMKNLKRREQHPTLFERFENRVWWPLERFKDKIFGIPDEIKYFIQRGRRGYADKDLWSFDYYIAGWMPDALRDFKRAMKKYGGVPTYFEYDLYKEKDPSKITAKQWKIAEKEWVKTINKMIAGFEANNKQDNLAPGKNCVKEWDKLEKVRLEGMGLFVKWFGGLWW